MSKAKVLSSQAIASGSAETVSLAVSENKDDLSTLLAVSLVSKMMVLLYLVSCFCSSLSIEGKTENATIHSQIFHFQRSQSERPNSTECGQAPKLWPSMWNGAITCVVLKFPSSLLIPPLHDWPIALNLQVFETRYISSQGRQAGPGYLFSKCGVHGPPPFSRSLGEKEGARNLGHGFISHGENNW